MREVLAQIHNIATQLENKKAFKQAEQLNDPDYFWSNTSREKL